MLKENYFKKNGYVYGDSMKFNFGRWEHHLHKFTKWDEAQEWLHTEEYDFRERELISRSEAIRRGMDVDWDEQGGYDFDPWKEWGAMWAEEK